MKRFIAFDLEGPLTPTDAVYELMGLAPNGHRIFEQLSLYDDYLVLSQRPGYEPGFTLALMTPFLAYHQISSRDLERIAAGAPLVTGAKDTVLRLKKEGFEIFVVTTAPCEFAWTVARRLGIEEDRVFATRFPIDQVESCFPASVLEKISNLEIEILEAGVELGKIAEILEKFYWGYLCEQGVDILKTVEVIGGMRKREILKRLAQRYDVELSRWAVVGDSITDQAILDKIKEEGGLAIVFNGNSYALEKGNVAISSLELGAVLSVCHAWQEGGLREVRKRILAQEREGVSGRKEIKEIASSERTYFWLPGKSERQFREIVEIHRKIRQKVRGEAGKLG
jgi:energy-converting hydrogenase A subunit R